MPKSIYVLLFLLLCCPCMAQTALPGEEAEEEQELRRYSVELIVFAYAEDVATGSELFLPEVVEVEQPSLIDERDSFWSLEGPVPDDSTADSEDDPDADDPDLDDEAASEGTDGAPRVLFNEFGERVNEDGMPIDDYGNLIYQTDPYALVYFREDQLTMLDTWDRLDELDAYEPLLHVGWAQAGLPREKTDPIPLEDFASPVPGLDGAFTLYLSRFLHLVVDLELAAERGKDLDGDGIIDEM
ncbi:MAG: CsiV family protein, partial [Pseudomonadota bacterium]